MCCCVYPLALRILDKRFASVCGSGDESDAAAAADVNNYKNMELSSQDFSFKNYSNDNRGKGSSGKSNPTWKYSSVISCIIVGAFWAVWHLPAFYVKLLSQNHCNFGQFLIQEMLYTGFYLWQANNNNHNILLALLMHSSINCFGGLVPWGDISFPPFTAMPNAMYTVVLLVFLCALISHVGVTLGRR